MIPDQPDAWSHHPTPKVVLVSGMHDFEHGVTYLPWSDGSAGLFGVKIVPDEGRNVLVYMIPTYGNDKRSIEIRCHLAFTAPDPESDRLLKKIELPDDIFD